MIHPRVGDGGASLDLFGLRLPVLCTFRSLTGIPCAGCGLTRAVVLLMHGRISDSIALHPFGIFAVGLALLQIPPRAARVAGSGATWIARWDWLWAIGAALVFAATIAWWIARLATGGLAR